MKRFIILFVLFFGCSNNPSIFEPEISTLEIKEWGRIATFNSSSAYAPWNGLEGMVVGHSIRNNHPFDLKIEYILHIRRARSDVGGFVPISESPLISSAEGLVCQNTTANLDPINIIKSNIIKSGEHLFAIAFAAVDWDLWGSIYATVTITGTTVADSKMVFKSVIDYPSIMYKEETK